MKIYALALISAVLLGAYVHAAWKSESSIVMASKFGCEAKKKIEIKDMLSQCECSDGTKCVWTHQRQPVYGCPCESPPTNTDYTCVKMALAMGCSDKKIECNEKFGQCECDDRPGICFWGGTKPMAGCPCPGGHIPEPEELVDKPEEKTSRRKKGAKKNAPHDDDNNASSKKERETEEL